MWLCLKCAELNYLQCRKHSIVLDLVHDTEVLAHDLMEVRAQQICRPIRRDKQSKVTRTNEGQRTGG